MVSLTPEGIVLGGHIAAGFVALAAGLVALLTEKGGLRHRRAGRVYVWSMAFVVGTVPVLLAFDPTDFFRQFLLLVAIFSGYLVFSGYRVLARKRPTDDGERIDRIAATVTVLASLVLGVWGVALVVDGTNMGVVLAVFGAIGAAFGGVDLRTFRNPDRRDPWMATHLTRMIGGYIATVSAISAVNLTGLVPAPVAWLWPTAVGVPVIWYFAATHVDSGPFAAVAD